MDQIKMAFILFCPSFKGFFKCNFGEKLHTNFKNIKPYIKLNNFVVE